MNKQEPYLYIRCILKGAGQARRVVTDLARELKIDPVLMSDVCKSDHTYLYAVSALKPKQSTESPPTSPNGK